MTDTTLRTIIKTKDDLSTLASATRQTLTPNKIIELLSIQAITDPSLSEQLQKASGKKFDKDLKTRLADAVVAGMLGFSSPYEMFKHYQEQPLIKKEIYLWEHRFGTDTISVYREKDISIGNLDLVALTSMEAELDRADENLNCIDTDESILTSVDLEANDELITHQAAGAVDLKIPHDKSYSVNDGSEDALDALMEVVESIDSCCSFQNSGNDILESCPEHMIFHNVNLNEVTTLTDYWTLAAKTLLVSVGYDESFMPSPLNSDKGMIDIPNSPDALIWSAKHQMMAVFNKASGVIEHIFATSLAQYDVRHQLFTLTGEEK